jgi:Tol biopolymer transport system component
MRRWDRTRQLICGICVPLLVAVATMPGTPAHGGRPGPGAIVLVSIARDGGVSDGASTGGRENGLGVSTHGRYVVFASSATDLVSGDVNGHDDVFVRDVVGLRTVLVSVGVGGVQGNGQSRQGSISADGRYVAFNSAASNLVPGDTNDTGDVFVRDLWRHRTILASTGVGGIADLGAHSPELSADGQHVAFTSSATNLVAGDTSDQDVFVRDLADSRTELVSVSTAGEQTESSASQPSVSADGRHVAFVGSGLATGPTPEPPAFLDGVVYVRDRVARTTQAVSFGIPVDPRAFVVDAGSPKLSNDGRVVVFAAIGWLGVGVDPIANVWLRDLRTGAAELISADRRGRPSSSLGGARADISADNRYVAFSSAGPLTRGDSGVVSDVFIRDRHTGRLAWLTRAQDQTDPFGAGSYGPAISDDGRHVVFESTDDRLAPPGGSGVGYDTYLWSGFGSAKPHSDIYRGE